MGLYITATQIETWLGTPLTVDLSNHDGSASTVDTDVVDECILSAESYVNSYIGMCAALPLTAPIPALVAQLSKSLTRWHLYDFHTGAIPDAITKDLERSEAILLKLSKCELTLGLDDSGDATPQPLPADELMQQDSNPRVFSRAGMRGF